MSPGGDVPYGGWTSRESHLERSRGSRSDFSRALASGGADI